MNAMDNLRAIADGRDIRTPGEIAAIEGVIRLICESFSRGMERRGEAMDLVSRDQHEIVPRQKGVILPVAEAYLLRNPNLKSVSIAASIGCSSSTVDRIRARMRREGKL